uniref:Uncharacterized protein n=1 Tax=Ananas comosus var. bracteatus TaxID=296719 RepID=A0A6V7NIJ6_ANACO|nr:unnamed protein product [Ananas comosus var. bracteatus]
MSKRHNNNSNNTPELSHGGEAVNGLGGNMSSYGFPSSTSDDINSIDIKGVDDSRGYFSPMNFDSCNFGVLDDFPRPAFDVAETLSPFCRRARAVLLNEMEKASDDDEKSQCAQRRIHVLEYVM